MEQQCEANGPGADDGTTLSSTQDPFRPAFHVTAPTGWLNDPCGPGYDPATGLYHLFFQWNPHGNVWGNMSWGHATSSNLFSWNTCPQPVLEPSAGYDRQGVFTGCLHPTDVHGDPGGLTIIYTSVQHLPIHYTLPYTVGSESLSLAVSSDGGETWQRHQDNPILPGPPLHVSVTGWRDPSLAVWDSERQDDTTNSKPSRLYGLISGGIVGQSPTVFLYVVDPKDLRRWEYAGPLVDVGLNFHPSRWSGDFGINWEVPTLITLSNPHAASRDFVIIKVEGAIPPDKSSLAPDMARQKRHPRYQNWMSIKPKAGRRRTTDDPLSDYLSAGVFDHGCFLAANSFWDPKTSRHIVYGWITEEDLSKDCRLRQGWSSMISLPRVVHLMTLRGVRRARSTPLPSITCIELVADTSRQDTYTIHTLGISPDPRLSGLRQGSQGQSPQGQQLPTKLTPSSECFIPLTSNRWELTAEFAVSRSCQRVGIAISHDRASNHRTTLAWDPTSEVFTIHRPPVQDADINHGFESAPHTLFTLQTNTGNEKEESLSVHAFFDNSVLEVFINERTAISTRIYYPSDRCFGIRFFAEADNQHSCANEATFLLQAAAWDRLGRS